MTDRYNALIVVLEKNTREDDAQALITAIEQFRGVAAVTPHGADVTSVIAEARVRMAIAQKLHDVLFPPVEEKSDGNHRG